MGLLDWFRGSKRPKDQPKPSIASGPQIGPVQKEDPVLDLLRKDLAIEKTRNMEQGRRIAEMEERFAEVQGKFVALMEKQTRTIEMMMNRPEPVQTVQPRVDPTPPEPKAERAPSRPGPTEDIDVHRPIDIDRAYNYGSVLRDKTFQNFVVDETNRFAYLATEAVATGVGRKYNPLFVYGPPGVGKTHLLHAMANKMIENDPRIKLLYSSTEVYTDELIAALESGDLNGFRRKYHDADVLLIDDIQTLSGKENTQLEFFHLFNHLYNLQKQIVLCSDRPPNEIKELESRLRSRFEGGLIIDINLPTFEGRRQILFNMASRSGISLSNEVMDYMAYYLDSNVRELEGGFNRVTAYAALMKETITISLVRKVLEGVLLRRPEGSSAMIGPAHDGALEEAVAVQKPKHRPVIVADADLEKETEQLERELLQELMSDMTPSS